MGLAKAAEFNGYPGPAHVLEHAQALGLSNAQRSASEALMLKHKAAAREIGKELVAAERGLESSRRRRVPRFGQSRGEGQPVGARFDLDLLGGEVDRNLGVGIHLLAGLGDGADAVATTHVGQFEIKHHENSMKWTMNARL